MARKALDSVESLKNVGPGFAGPVAALAALVALLVGMVVNGGLSWQAAILADLIYWPGDIVKNVVASGIAVAVHRAFPTLLARPVVGRKTAATVGA